VPRPRIPGLTRPLPQQTLMTSEASLHARATGALVRKRIAAPMVGGPASSFRMELIIYPVLYELWKSGTLLPLAEMRHRTRPEGRN
jgi:hypothetical protein